MPIQVGNGASIHKYYTIFILRIQAFHQLHIIKLAQFVERY